MGSIQLQAHLRLPKLSTLTLTERAVPASDELLGSVVGANQLPLRMFERQERS